MVVAHKKGTQRTLLREELDDRRFERGNLRADCAVLKLDIELDGPEMRKPVQMFVRLEEMEFLGV